MRVRVDQLRGAYARTVVRRTQDRNVKPVPTNYVEYAIRERGVFPVILQLWQVRQELPMAWSSLLETHADEPMGQLLIPRGRS